MMATENLQAAKLIPGIKNAVGGISTEYVHLLELTDDGCAKISNRRSNTRQHGVIVTERLLSKVEIGYSFAQVNRKFQRIKNLNLMTALQRCLLESACAVGVWCPRENGKFHGSASSLKMVWLPARLWDIKSNFMARNC